MNTPMVPFVAGSPMYISGPTQCGKTYWVNKLLSYDMFTRPVSSVLYCYGIYQDFYDTMKENLRKKCPVRFLQGLPSLIEVDNLNDGNFHIIIFDDLMESLVRNADMVQIFTKMCHHMHFTAILLSQNLFQPGPYARTISLNCHIFILFSNKRDESQVRTLARQLYPSKWKRFMDMYQEEMQHSFSYLVVDCTPSQPPEIKVRTGVFPHEMTCTYDL